MRAGRGRVFPLTPGFVADDLPQARPAVELLAHLPEELAAPAALSDAEILGEIEERTWAAQLRLEDGIADRGQDSVAALADGVASPELQAFHDEYQALYLLTRGLREHLGLPLRPPGLGHFTAQPIPGKLRAALAAEGMAPDEGVEALRRVRAAFRSGDIRLVDRVVAYPVTIVRPSEPDLMVMNFRDLVSAREIVLSPAIRARIVAEPFERMATWLEGLSLSRGEPPVLMRINVSAFQRARQKFDG